MQKEEQTQNNPWNIKTILIIFFIIILIYFYLQSNNSVKSVIKTVTQSGGTIQNLENISRILKKF